MILCEHQNDLAKFIPSNQLELERLEQMLDYLNTHFGSVISLQELADQVHLSREVCCRLFKKNDRQNNYRLSGRISCQQKSASGSEPPIFYDPDCRYDRFPATPAVLPGHSADNSDAIPVNTILLSCKSANMVILLPHRYYIRILCQKPFRY